MAIPPIDFQVHNSLFLIAHFHNVIIGGVVFGFFAAWTYWFPKAFGFRLNERLGQYAFWFWVVGFYVAFMPLYVLGLSGVMRRTQHYANLSYQPYFVLAAIGSVLILIGFAFQVAQVIYSIRHRDELRDHSGDPWDGRTLEWATSSPAPFYNFAFIPEVSQIDDYWEQKQLQNKEDYVAPPSRPYQDIHMPKNTACGFIIAIFGGMFCFAVIWHMLLLGIVGAVGVIGTAIARSFNTDTDYYVKAAEVERIELAFKKQKEAAS